MPGLRFLVAIGLLLAAAPPVGAAGRVTAPTEGASFDCARAASPREHAICATPALADLDGRLGRLYRSKLALLSVDGARRLRDVQRGWLAFLSTVCAPSSRQTKPANCLEGLYRERIVALGTVRRLGPFVVNRIDLFATRPAPDDNGQAPGFVVHHVAYPQIDRPASPALVAWNANAVRDAADEADCDFPDGDEVTDYRLGYASRRLISVAWDHGTYCHGTPHGFGDTEVENTILSDPPRALVPADLFGPGDAWRGPMQAAFGRALAASGWRPPPGDPDAAKALMTDAVDPDRWLIGAAGIIVPFSSYEGGCYACTPQPVTIPWSAIRPLLKADAIAP